MARAILAFGLLLVLLGLTACSGSTYLVKPGTADPVRVVKCETHLSAKSALLAVIFLPLGFIAQWQDYQDCLEQRHNEGYVDASKEPECAYWRDDKPGKELKIRDSCKDNLPAWALRRDEVTPHVAVAPSAPIARAPDANPAGSPATTSLAPGPREPYPDEAAIKKVLDNVMDAINKADLNRLLGQFSDDARIDSKSAGGKVSKQRYKEAMAVVFARSNVLIEHRYNSVVVGDAGVTVTGTVQIGSRLFPNEWKLQQRAGRWVIVETSYK